MGGSKPLKQNAIDGKKSMEPFSPAVENAKQAGMYSLLHKPLSGKNAKKQMAAAMKDKNGFKMCIRDRLEGVQFSIINRSATAIKYGDKTVNPGEEVTKITTSWNSNLKKYTAQTDERTLPYGTYGVQEISSSQGYKMTDGTEKIVVCHGADGTMSVSYTHLDVYKRQGYIFRNGYNLLIKIIETIQVVSNGKCFK